MEYFIAHNDRIDTPCSKAEAILSLFDLPTQYVVLEVEGDTIIAELHLDEKGNVIRSIPRTHEPQNPEMAFIAVKGGRITGKTVVDSQNNIVSTDGDCPVKRLQALAGHGEHGENG